MKKKPNKILDHIEVARIRISNEKNNGLLGVKKKGGFSTTTTNKQKSFKSPQKNQGNGSTEKPVKAGKQAKTPKKRENKKKKPGKRPRIEGVNQVTNRLRGSAFLQ